MSGDPENADELHNVEASLLRFIDRPLLLSDVLSLGAQAAGADIEVIAEVLDCLVASGELECHGELVYPADRGGSWCVAAQFNGGFYNIATDGEQLDRFTCDEALEFLHIHAQVPFSDAEKLLKRAFRSSGFWIKAEGENSFSRKTEYDEDRYDLQTGNSPAEPLDAQAADDSVLALYREWLAIVERHPEWRARLQQRPNDPEITSIDVGNPNAAMQGVEDRFEYDKSSVRPEDQAEFDRFLALDSQIKAYEGKNPPRNAALHSLETRRATAMAKMSGMVRQADMGIGLFLKSDKLMLATGETNPMKISDGDVILFYASDLALQQHGADLNNLPFDEQLELMEEAEDMLLKERQKQVQADMGMSMDGEPAPAPDPVKAPQGWESIQDASGKKTWRSKSDPNVTLERPQ